MQLHALRPTDLGSAAELIDGSADDVGRDRPQRTTRGQREQLGLARPLEEIQPIERFGHGPADDQRAVIGHHQHRFVAEHAREPFAFAAVEREAVVVHVVRDVLVENQGALNGHFQPGIFQHAERGGVRHVGVQHAVRTGRHAVDRKVDVERRILDRPVPDPAGAVEVDFHEVGCAYFRPMQAKRRQIESVRPPRHQQSQVVIDAFVQAEAHRQPMAGCQIDPGTPGCFGIHESTVLIGLRAHGPSPDDHDGRTGGV